jgi:2-oxoglutarate dehydrogenase E1 component
MAARSRSDPAKQPAAAKAKAPGACAPAPPAASASPAASAPLAAAPAPAARRDPLAEAFRRWGYLQADLDPMGRLAPLEHPELADACAGAAAPEIARWRALYCGTIGAEFMHITDEQRCRWVAARLEEPPPAVDHHAVLARLAEAELFERFLHARYVGSKRYSLEGVAAIIPLLDSCLQTLADQHGETVLIAMSHRGRLNVMANVVRVPGAELFAGIEDVDPRSVLGSGDVKYHLGATGDAPTAAGGTLRVHLVSNPSHLEAVDPVILGRARARQERLGEDGPRRVVAILLHGDAAFAGQGIAAEVLNMADLRGFTVGGCIHVLVNNLVGFTATPAALHSSRFASDLAKRLSIPILHVNGEDPDAVVRVARLAAEYRSRFASDVLIDLIGFRRYGHSEVEDPTTTQPILYRKIEAHPMLWEVYAQRIGASAEALGQLREQIHARLTHEQAVGRAQQRKPVLRTLPPYWDRYHGGRWDAAYEVDTRLPPEHLAEVARLLTRVPEGFNVHPKLKKLMEQRREMGEGQRAVDWAMAEALAFGSLVWDGMLVRLTGEDSRRGTFNQRHAVLIDRQTEAEHIPLRHLRAGQGRFDVYDTCLSEAAALGFEYGFSRDFPDALVCWEAQFGDFANGAQIVIDQFLSAGEDKWGLLSGLVLLLPHGFEGQGPEHSSARIERFLQLAAEDNLQICQPSSAAQYYHLLRRQALLTWRKPLIVFTPKGMLRAEAAASPLAELAAGRFQPVVADATVQDAQRLIFCSGKIAHELAAQRSKRNALDVAIAQLVQLYPFPEQAVQEELLRHRDARKIVWVQEEPANMGALSYVRPHLQRLAGERHVTSVKRSASASPATGSTKAHALEQQALLGLAFA